MDFKMNSNMNLKMDLQNLQIKINELLLENYNLKCENIDFVQNEIILKKQIANLKKKLEFKLK